MLWRNVAMLLACSMVVLAGGVEETCHDGNGVCKKNCDPKMELQSNLPGCCHTNKCCVPVEEDETCGIISPLPSCPEGFESIEGQDGRAYKRLDKSMLYNQTEAACEAFGVGVHIWYPETIEERTAIMNHFGDFIVGAWTSMKIEDGVLTDVWCNTWQDLDSPPYGYRYTPADMYPEEVVFISLRPSQLYWIITHTMNRYSGICEIVEKTIASIYKWKSHILCSKNQDKARQFIVNTLQDNQAFIVADWAMKFLPRKYREGQTDWFGKRGINWHISFIMLKTGESVKHLTHVHIFEGPLPQGAPTTAALLVDVVQSIAGCEKVYILSDNAGCYKSTLTLAIVHQELGVTQEFPEVCFFCGDFEDIANNEEIAQLKTDFSIVRPICEGCMSRGIKPSTRNAKKVKKSKQ